MAFVESVVIQCPYCWQQFEILVDPSVKRQEYVEDCQVCCRPIIIKVTFDDNAVPSVEALREDE